MVKYTPDSMGARHGPRSVLRLYRLPPGGRVPRRTGQSRRSALRGLRRRARAADAPRRRLRRRHGAGGGLIMPIRYMFNSRKREQLWLREKGKARIAGRGPLPICNLCDRAVREQDAWDESHVPHMPKAFGGKVTGIAHHLCNITHGATVVRKAVEKSNRVRRKHIGAAGRGLGRYPMRGGPRGAFKIGVGGGRQPRTTSAERHAAMIASRTLRDADGNPIGVWAPDPPHVEG